MRIHNDEQAGFYRRALSRHINNERRHRSNLAWATQEVLRAAARGDWKDVRKVAGWQAKEARELGEAVWRIPVIREALAEWDAR